MKRSIPLVLLAGLLLGMGIVVGASDLSAERTGAAREAAPLLGVAPEEPAPVDRGPLLLARCDDAGPEGELARLREALEHLRAERDRLAADLAQLQEQAQRWQALVELEGLQRAAHEVAAIATSRNAISALAQVQASARIDEDRDGVGEFAGFLEMSGAAVGRIASGAPLVPPVLSSAFRTLTKEGEVYRSGYFYRIFLPDARGEGVGEGPAGFLPSQVDADLAETTWCMYAWPAVGGVPGQKTYFTNQGGDVLATEDAHYAGPGNGPAPDAAFRGPGITGLVAIGATGMDGNTWKQVN